MLRALAKKERLSRISYKQLHGSHSFNRLIFGLYEINLRHALALRIMSDYSFSLFATNLFPKSFKFKFIDF